MLQLFLPSIEKDQHHYGKKMEFHPFSHSSEGCDGAPSNVELLSYHSTEFVRDHNFVVEMLYPRKLQR
jgi:hypothetical protein